MLPQSYSKMAATKRDPIELHTIVYAQDENNENNHGYDNNHDGLDQDNVYLALPYREGTLKGWRRRNVAHAVFSCLHKKKKRNSVA